MIQKSEEEILKDLALWRQKGERWEERMTPWSLGRQIQRTREAAKSSGSLARGNAAQPVTWGFR